MPLSRPSSRQRLTWRMIMSLCALLLPGIMVIGVGPVGAADIASGGPLTVIRTTPDLNCAVSYLGDSHGEWYDNTACGTFVTDGSRVYGPADISAGEQTQDIAWTPVSQVGPSGAGTAADPY